MWLACDRKIFLCLPNRSETGMFLDDAGLIHTKEEAMLAPTRLSPSSAPISTAAATHGLLLSGGARSCRCRRRRSPWHMSGTSIHQQKQQRGGTAPKPTAHPAEYAFSVPIPLQNLSINVQSCASLCERVPGLRPLHARLGHGDGELPGPTRRHA
jgi:hypothetical protein